MTSGRVDLIQGADTDRGAASIGEWVRANHLDPGTINGVVGVRVHYGPRRLEWTDASGEQRSGPLMVEPSPEVLAAGSLVKAKQNPLSSAERHAAVLAALDDQIGDISVYSGSRANEQAVLGGRRRIVERHAPESEDKARSFAAHYCDYARCYDALDEWPCDDYRDAAADLLPAEGIAT